MSELRSKVIALALFFYGHPPLPLPELRYQVPHDRRRLVSHARNHCDPDCLVCVVSSARHLVVCGDGIAFDHMRTCDLASSIFHAREDWATERPSAMTTRWPNHALHLNPAIAL